MDLAAVAYHLGLKGLGSEVVLLEQDRLVLIFIRVEKMSRLINFIF